VPGRAWIQRQSEAESTRVAGQALVVSRGWVME
jgi:hypothetical protein